MACIQTASNLDPANAGLMDPSPKSNLARIKASQLRSEAQISAAIAEDKMCVGGAYPCPTTCFGWACLHTGFTCAHLTVRRLDVSVIGAALKRRIVGADLDARIFRRRLALRVSTWA